MEEDGRRVKSNGAYTGGIFGAADSTRANVGPNVSVPLQRGKNLAKTCIRLKIGYSDRTGKQAVNGCARTRLNGGFPEI